MTFGLTWQFIYYGISSVNMLVFLKLDWMLPDVMGSLMFQPVNCNCCVTFEPCVTFKLSVLFCCEIWLAAPVAVEIKGQYLYLVVVLAIRNYVDCMGLQGCSLDDGWCYAGLLLIFPLYVPWKIGNTNVVHVLHATISTCFDWHIFLNNFCNKTIITR